MEICLHRLLFSALEMIIIKLLAKVLTIFFKKAIFVILIMAAIELPYCFGSYGAFRVEYHLIFRIFYVASAGLFGNHTGDFDYCALFDRLVGMLF